MAIQDKKKALLNEIHLMENEALVDEILAMINENRQEEAMKKTMLSRVHASLVDIEQGHDPG